MNRTNRGRLGAALMAGVLALTTACGGDDDGDDATAAPPEADASDDADDGDDGDDASADADDAPTGTLDDAAFCARFEELEDEFDDGDDDLDAEAFAALAELAAAAPDPAVGSALLKFGELAEQLDGLDEDDPAAFGIALGMMFDPEFIAAMESIERYLVDVCGFEDTGFESDFGDGFDDGFDDVVDIPYDEDAWDAVFDDLSVVRDPIEDELGSVRGLGVFSMMGSPTLTVDIDPSEVDPLEACEVVADIWDATLSADGLPVEINDDDFELIASRPAGGTCMPE